MKNVKMEIIEKMENGKKLNKKELEMIIGLSCPALPIIGNRIENLENSEKLGDENKMEKNEKIENVEKSETKENILTIVMTSDYLENLHREVNSYAGEISFIDSYKKDLEKIMKDRKSDEFELVMHTYESRKIYYLGLIDLVNNSYHFIMKNDSIMKNKIFTLKLSQIKDSEFKINYYKSGRKSQASENISKNSREYMEKLKKYSSI